MRSRSSAQAETLSAPAAKALSSREMSAVEFNTDFEESSGKENGA
jgi:hypothetical protein